MYESVTLLMAVVLILSMVIPILGALLVLSLDRWGDRSIRNTGQTESDDEVGDDQVASHMAAEGID